MFKISTNGVFTTLYGFRAGPDGACPAASLIQAGNGDFYGTTKGYLLPGLAPGTIPGSVFQMTPDGVLTVLLTGGLFYTGLAQGDDGDFYGMIEIGGANAIGAVYKISASGTLTTLHSFDGMDGSFLGFDDSRYPEAGLIQGFDGSFYGATDLGGADGSLGTVFKISTNGVLSTLSFFTTGRDGGIPQGGLVQGRDGNFYGTASTGGPEGAGTVFRLEPVSEPVIVSAPGDHAYATGETLSLRVDATGPGLTYQWEFDGTCIPGATNSTLVLDDVSPAQAGAYTVVVFDAAGAVSSPVATVAIGPAWPPLTAPGLRVLHSFSGLADGANPEAGLVRGSDGSFYGTTENQADSGYGTVFKISTNGALTTLYRFGSITNADGHALDGAHPGAGLVQGGDGSFYGTTYEGGPYTNQLFGQSGGMVFKISAAGALTSLYSFSGGIDGAFPNGLVPGRDGDFYGTTQDGGANYHGTVFKIGTTGELTTLYAFGSVTNAGGHALDGAIPAAGIVQGSDGNFYGTTYEGGPNDAGTVFKISTTGAITTLYSFSGADGASPAAALVQAGDGNFYGTTFAGGANGYGTVFKISASGTLTTVYAFGTVTDAGGDPLDGANPTAALVQGGDGNFYGTTTAGGVDDAGTLFQIDTNGILTALYSFTGGDDGSQPAAGLAPGSDDTFYGTTLYGGTNNAGTVFVYNLPAPPSLGQPVLSAQGVSLSVQTQNGVNYVLEYKNLLTDPSWTPTQTIAGNGLVVTFTDADASVPSRFYRVRVVGP